MFLALWVLQVLLWLALLLVRAGLLELVAWGRVW